MTPPLYRAACWSGFIALVALDAAIASPVSLGLFYFVPLAATAFWARGIEAMGMAVLAAAGRFLFGPFGDPLGLRTLTFQLTPEVDVLVNVVVSALAYLAGAGLIVRLRRQQQQIARLGDEATRDPLTGLGNRRVLDALLTTLKGRQVSVLAIDLDHFKRVNDVWGHGAGDEVLRELAVRLRRCVREGDVVVRTGGEEFIIILPMAPLEAAIRVVERVLTGVREVPFRAGGQDLPLTTSAGVATGAASEALLEEADEALYAAKQAGRNRFSVSGASAA